MSEVEDFVDFLASKAEAERIARIEEMDLRIAEYAAEFGGTKLDLDPDLEAASVETLLALGGHEK